jgi:uncharacterized protein YbbK (DUF523 family)
MFAIPQFDSRRFFYADSASACVVIGVSACLAGAAVRYDGQSKNLDALQQWPQQSVRLLPICPEVGAGLSVPRPPVQLVASDLFVSGQNNPTRAVGRDDSRIDVTAELQQFAHNSVQALAREHGLCGYIWKSRSPSCGFGSTPLFDTSGAQIDSVSGIQAQAVNSALPWLIAVEETDLATAGGAAQFLLLCRLIFDARWASSGNAELHAWHRHYTFLLEAFSEDDRTALQHAAAAGERDNYLVRLQHSCRKIAAEQLLGLFVL